jgi:hypothetical protein
MSKSFRVLDCALPDGVLGEHLCSATTPEGAAWSALGVTLVRSGCMEDLRAKVYFQAGHGTPTMVRLYTQAVQWR